MKIITKKPFAENGFFALQDQNWLDKQRLAGRIAAKTLSYLEKLILDKTTCSTLELDSIAEKMIIESGGIPTFKNYRKFPSSLCASINNQLVHGIPNNYKLQDGDVISIDLGVTVDEAIADTALTCIFGNPKQEWHVKLISATKEALEKGIAAISVGKRLGVIGNAIYKSARGNGFSVIEKYGGHGISCDKNGKGILHAPPFVANKTEPNDGIRLQPGLILCLEPMLGIGDTNTVIGSDGWTVYTKNIFAHEEHSVFVHQDRVEVITDRINL